MLHDIINVKACALQESNSKKLRGLSSDKCLCFPLTACERPSVNWKSLVCQFHTPKTNKQKKKTKNVVIVKLSQVLNEK